MDLTWTIVYAVQAGRARIVSFIWLLSLTGLRATESGVDRHVISVVTVVSTLMSVAAGLPLLFLASEVPGSLVLLLLQASQLSRPHRSGS